MTQATILVNEQMKAFVQQKCYMGVYFIQPFTALLSAYM